MNKRTGLLAFLLATCSCAFSQDSLSTLTGDIRVHDPVMIKEGSTYFVFHTGKGISIKTSPDRIHWTKAGQVFKDSTYPDWHRKDIPEQDRSLWAPDIIFIKENITSTIRFPPG
jgi:arabinan endo-1,5-alpha-L-arabinosidase